MAMNVKWGLFGHPRWGFISFLVVSLLGVYFLVPYLMSTPGGVPGFSGDSSLLEGNPPI